MIAKVIIEENFIKVYDENKNIISSVEASNKEIVGFASDYYITDNNAMIELYSSGSKFLSSMPKDGKIVTGTVGDTFIVQNGIYVESYDMNCRIVSINNVVSAIAQFKKRDFEIVKANLNVELERLNNLKITMVNLYQFEAAMSLLPITRKLEEMINLF